MDTMRTHSLSDSVSLYSHLVPYLESTDWYPTDAGNKHWAVWHHRSTAEGQPYELVFPLHRSDEERRAYVTKAIYFLAAFHQETEERLTLRIVNYDRDLLFVRNIDTNMEQMLPLDRVVDQLSGLQQVLIYTASVEREPKPFTHNIPAMARRLIRDFSFNHTRPGSFIFTVGAPRLSGPMARSEQLSLGGDNTFLEEGPSDPTQPIRQFYRAPFVRRLSERLARGLQSSQAADLQHNPDLLLDDYGSGLNSNMCSALVTAAARGTVEFQIAWSPKVRPAEDIANMVPIPVTPDSCEKLEYAARKLRAVKPEAITIDGYVRGLAVSDNPGNPASHRAVVLQGADPRTGRSARFVVDLATEDYNQAIEAHRGWTKVQVRGIPSRTGDGWRLSNASDFIILE